MGPTTAASARRRSGNRRDEDARLAVLHAADDLLAEHGFAKVTVEAIARQARVAKQTIYRWWPSKVEILLDTLIEGADKELWVPDGTPSATDVDDYFERLRIFIEERPDGKVFLALLGHAQHDPSAARLLRNRFLEPRRSIERDLLERASSSGAVTLPDGVDAAINARVGPILYHAMTAI